MPRERGILSFSDDEQSETRGLAGVRESERGGYEAVSGGGACRRVRSEGEPRDWPALPRCEGNVRTREVRRWAPPPARRATLPSPCRGTRLSLPPPSPPPPLLSLPPSRRAAPRPHASARDIGRTTATAAATAAAVAVAAAAAKRCAAHGATTAVRANRRRVGGPLSRDALVTGCRSYAVRRFDTLRRAQHALLTRTVAAVRRTAFTAIRIRTRTIRNARFRRESRNVAVVIVVVACRGGWWWVIDGEV